MRASSSRCRSHTDCSRGSSGRAGRPSARRWARCERGGSWSGRRTAGFSTATRPPSCTSSASAWQRGSRRSPGPSGCGSLRGRPPRAELLQAELVADLYEAVGVPEVPLLCASAETLADLCRAVAVADQLEDRAANCVALARCIHLIHLVI